MMERILDNLWPALFGVTTGYLIGSIPWGVILARLFRGPDPRTVGSTHTGATNVFRNVHPVAGVLTGVLDFIKGVAAVWLVMRVFPEPWLLPLTGVAAVAGHCWPVFLNFRGGMGVATAGALVLWQFPQVIPIFAIAYLLLDLLVIKHQARTMMLLAALLPLMLLPFRPAPEKMMLATGLAIVLVIRWASDFNRVYD